MVHLVPRYRLHLQSPELESLPATLPRSPSERLQACALQAVTSHIIMILHLYEKSTITESVCCTSETNITLANNYAAIKTDKKADT